ncbi:MAG TPA: hypothetical protein VEA38_23465, partial [Terriglobales bacterium]|nr:hypothetical protein [Terriglobales bacterium]
TSRAPRAVGYASLALVGLLLVPWWSRAPEAPVLPAMSAAVPASAVESHKTQVEAVTSRGVIRFSGRTLELDPDSWLIAMSTADGSVRRLEARRSGAGETTLRWVVDGRDARFDRSAAEWLAAVIERRGYDAARTRADEIKAASGGSGTYLTWLRNRVEAVSFWSTSGSGIERDGSLDPSANARSPVYVIHQASPDAPVEFMALAREGDRLRVLERSVDARPAPTDADAEAKARETLRRIAEWTYD